MTRAQKCVVLGTSAGGVDALKMILPMFRRPSLFSVVVVIHLPPSGPNLIPSLFEKDCDFAIKEAESGESMEAETIYIAPPDYHLSVEPNWTLALSTEGAVNFSRPSIDILFDSAAYSLGPQVMGVLLTGANSDGAQGLLKIQKEGGKAVVQLPSTAEYSTMPQSAVDLFKPDLIVRLDELSEVFLQFQGENNL